MARRLSVSTVLGILLFIAFFDNFTQIPMISPYATFELGASAVMAGWIVGIYSLTNMLGNVGAGWVLDKMGRRVPLAVGLIWAGLGVWLYGVVGTPLGLLGARAFHGLGGSILVPAIFTLAADLLSEDNRGAGMGRIGAMIGLAAIAGPMFSGIVRQLYGPHAVFTSVFVLMFLGGLYALTLPETLSRRSKGTEEKEKGSIPIPFSATPFKIASAAGFGIAFYMGTLTLLLPLHMELLGFAESRAGSVFSIFAIVAVIVMIFFGRLAKKGLLSTGFFAIGVGFAALSVGNSFGVIAFGMALYGLGFGLVYPTLNTQVAALYRPQERGRAYGIFYAFYSLGVVLAPPLVGWLTGFVSHHTVYGLLAVAAGLASYLLYQFRRLLAAVPEKAGSTAV